MKFAPYPPTALDRLERALDDLIASVAEPGTYRTDDEQIWLTRLLVVRSCGYLEQVVHQCSVAHLEAKSGGTARSFALSWLTRSRNPSPDNIHHLLGRFDAGAADEFEAMLEDNGGELKQELSVLVARRHGIAHGLNEGLGSRRALELSNVAKHVADWYILTMNPDRARAALTTSATKDGISA